jgi:hypothetical protein
MQRILHLGAKELDLTKEINVTSSETILNKPNFGSNCLWGSSLIKLPGGGVSSSWKEYVSGNYDNKDFNYGISFTLHRNSKILEIDSLDDYIEIMKKYSYSHTLGYCLDFKEISKDYDAFHLTENGFWSLRMRLDSVLYNLKYDTFYSYDAESWIIFNMNCINKGSILNHNNVVYYYEYYE